MARMVKLILREKEYDVRPGMTLLSALEKSADLIEASLSDEIAS